MSSKNEGQKKRQPNYKIVPKPNKVGGRLGAHAGRLVVVGYQKLSLKTERINIRLALL